MFGQYLFHLALYDPPKATSSYLTSFNYNTKYMGVPGTEEKN
jgi:hypothetical protein